MSQLLVQLVLACHMEAVQLSGYWKAGGAGSVQPGERLAAHNHSWVAVKVRPARTHTAWYGIPSYEIPIPAACNVCIGYDQLNMHFQTKYSNITLEIVPVWWCAGQRQVAAAGPCVCHPQVSQQQAEAHVLVQAHGQMICGSYVFDECALFMPSLCADNAALVLAILV